MSTGFKPIEIPPGVVAKPTKKMRSSNWAEVNMVRWRESLLMPMGGQSQKSFETNISVSAVEAFTTSSLTISLASNPGTIRPGMPVIDSSLGGALVGTTASVGPGSGTIMATAAFTTDYAAIYMPPNPGWVTAGMDVVDTIGDNDLGTVASYAPFSVIVNAAAAFSAGDTTFDMGVPIPGVLPGMTVFDQTQNQLLGVVQSFLGTVLTLTAGAPFYSPTDTDRFVFSSGGNYVLVLTDFILHNSAGVNDPLSFGGSSAWLLTLTAPSFVNSSGDADSLQFTGEGYTFQSRCKLVHGWHDVNSTYRTAYLCEQHLYVDNGGNLLEITPADGINPPAGLVGGFGDLLYENPPPPDDLYGTPRPIGANVAITKPPDAYSLDNFGGILYAMTSSDGRLLMWDPDVGGQAIEQPSDPGPPDRGPVPRGRCFVVTQERFIMMFGTYNDGTVGQGSPRRFAWCDQENPGAWDYSNVTSQAGFLDVEPSSPIICAETSRVGILFWTAKKVYASRFLGFPYIYNYVELADGTTPWSPQSVCATSALVLWMSEQGVWAYDGTSILPVACLVRPWIDDDIDPINVREVSFACHLGEFNEWWWFFPTLNSPFNTRAAVYNYRDGWWTQVRMSRSAGAASSYTSHPIFADDFVAFEHEVYQGAVYANASMPVVLPFAETFDLNLGPKLMTVKQLIPDIEAIDTNDPNQIALAIQNLRYSILYRNSRSIGDVELSSRGLFRPNGYVDFRVTGRDLRLRIDVGTVIQPFTIGAHLIDAVSRGDR